MAKQSQSSISVPASLVLQIEAWGRLTVKLLGRLRGRAGLKSQRTLDDQAWYWSEQWERQADEDMVAGQVREFGSVDELIADLDV